MVEYKVEGKTLYIELPVCDLCNQQIKITGHTQGQALDWYFKCACVCGAKYVGFQRNDNLTISRTGLGDYIIHGPWYCKDCQSAIVFKPSPYSVDWMQTTCKCDDGLIIMVDKIK